MASWALDSGGFTELASYGKWHTAPAAYVADVRRFANEIGHMDWVAPQDWMCEPFMLAKTGLSVAVHQMRTVENYIELRMLAPELPFIPVLQGWTIADYHRCLDMYERVGVDLWACDAIGLGSVCRRQATAEIEAIVQALSISGLRLHGFGVKSGGLNRFAGDLVSADSMAWSFRARREPPLAGHTHKNCANCLPYAEGWRDRLLAGLGVAVAA